MTVTTSSTGSSLLCQPRWATPRRFDRPTYGGKVAETARIIGKPLMPWQQYVADVALEVDPATGLLVYREVVVHVMRQQGKTTLQLPVMTQRCLGFKPSPQHVTYAAQSGVAARDKLLDEHAPLLQASPLRKLLTVRRQSGHEALVWRNRSRLTITAATEKAGHGITLDLGVIDEAFAYVDARLEQAFVPAMQTRKQPQLWIMSTAGTEDSTYLKAKVDAGRARVEAGETDLVAYFEWSFAPEDDPYSPETWHRRMPALGHTVDENAIASASVSMDEREYLRAFGNMWIPRTALDPVIDAQVWSQLFDRQSRALDPIAMSIDVSPDRSSAAIGVAGETSDALMHVEVADYRPGTSWVVARALEMRERWKPCAIAIDAKGPAGSLVAPLEAAGVELTFIGGREMTAACGGFYDDAINDALRHLDQAPLNAALAGARKRQIGDAWAWDRRDPTIDICPLVAVTLARYAYTVHAEPDVDVLNTIY